MVVWAVLIGRLYYLSIKSNTYFEELAERNTIKTEPLIPIRGLIMDRDGRPLAVNRLGFGIALPPHMNSKSRKKELEKSIETIRSFFPDLEREELLKTYKKQESPYNHDDITIVPFLPYDRVHKVYSRLLLDEWLKILPATKRYYPNQRVASHLIGYVGRANHDDIAKNPLSKLTGIIGKNGLEKQYNDYLQGEPGEKRIKVTAFNQEIGEITRRSPVENNDLVLHLDMRLQDYFDDSFREKNGAAIIMDVHTGALLAAGSYPGYDINFFVDGISQKNWQELISDPHHPFTNKLTSGLYPPGSVIKPGVAIALLRKGDLSEDDTSYCSGEMELGGRKFRCWKKEGHGKVDVERAIRESCDDYFYKGSLKTGIDDIAEVLRKMGLGQKTGVDLPNEFIGIVPDRHWKELKYQESWYLGETLVSAIGQGYTLVTPMQVAVYTGLIATGKLVRPHLVKSPENLAQPFSKDVLNSQEKSHLPVIRKAMKEVCEHPRGTAYWHLRGAKVPLAGKTGTAQVVGIAQDVKERMEEEDMEYFHRSHAWLSVYAPADNPQYVITVMVEHGGHGGSAAGGIITGVVNKMVEYGYMKGKK